MDQPPPSIVSNPRIDLAVTTFSGLPMRSTSYSGQIQLGATALMGEMFGSAAVRGGGDAKFDGGLFIPDSLPYLAAELGSGYLVPHIWLASIVDRAFVIRAAATFGPDPSNPGLAWVQLDLEIIGRVGTVVGYQVTALVPPDAVDQPR